MRATFADDSIVESSLTADATASPSTAFKEAVPAAEKEATLAADAIVGGAVSSDATASRGTFDADAPASVRTSADTIGTSAPNVGTFVDCWVHLDTAPPPFGMCSAEVTDRYCRRDTELMMRWG